jgi:hypothetical protein
LQKIINDVLDFRAIDTESFKWLPKPTPALCMINTIVSHYRQGLPQTTKLSLSCAGFTRDSMLLLDCRYAMQIIGSGLR